MRPVFRVPLIAAVPANHRLAGRVHDRDAGAGRFDPGGSLTVREAEEDQVHVGGGGPVGVHEVEARNDGRGAGART
jgi:hypothetical protein